MENETTDRSGLLYYPSISSSTSVQGFYPSIVAAVATNFVLSLPHLTHGQSCEMFQQGKHVGIRRNFETSPYKVGDTDSSSSRFLCACLSCRCGGSSWKDCDCGVTLKKEAIC